MEYTTANTTSAVAPVGPLEAAINRLSAITDGLHGIACNMENHADALFGERPPALDKATGVSPVRSGLMGNLENALDRLTDAQARLSEACSRNSTLA